MPSYIHQLHTLVPPISYAQEYARDFFKSLTQDNRTRRLIHTIYQRSGIDRRHSVCADFDHNASPTLFLRNGAGQVLSPSTKDRNRVYASQARSLAVELTRQLLADSQTFQASDITHVIFASCTGFANPGPDYHLIRELGLQSHVERYTLGFMGCYAAIPALRMAAQFCEARPDAVVLVICLELCSLHMQISDQPDHILANSLFADGAAAALVSGIKPAADQPAFQLLNFATELIPSGEAEMAWEIGNEGFNIVLSSYVPDIIGANVGALVKGLLSRVGIQSDTIGGWAVHPGGRSILDKVQAALGLPENALASSRRVLREFGNMSSATILFVLKHLLSLPDYAQPAILAMAFGPGLTVETAILERIGTAAHPDATPEPIEELFSKKPALELAPI